jgi:hypothetical protein
MTGLKMQRYLGDGVYAGYDGHQIWLWADRDGQRHSIALEYDTLTAFARYGADVKRLIAAIGPDAMKREQI